ncbi:PREDICTED: beta-1,4-glucuronyltransferase 1 [Drosophila arizonae]|uniref:Beta-1,4-glucuronyltransferase 1 n=1 Tax=Drosophila arizonae TaxID=7263 RepID=A0ABM1PN36_DROAR|nr:PREDICTED: beta-1,4-glucuronyltransferase 1 [Drosophila arizonae]
MFRLPHGSLIKIIIVLLFVNILLLVKVYPPYKSVTNGSSRHPTNTDGGKTKATVPLNCPYHSDVGPQMTMSTTNLEHFISESNKTKLTFANIDISYGRWDNQHKYKIKDFAVVGEQYTESSKISLICLATQSSVERLYSLPQVAANWIGPMSVALFSAGNEEYIVLKYFVTYMRLCFPNVKANATFHILFPQEYENLPGHLTEPLNIQKKFNCRNPEKTLKFLLKLRTAKTLEWRKRNVYPQNHMRNLARKGCQSKYVFLTDIDIIPSVNSVVQLNHFFKTVDCEKNCAYVIPTFEIDVRASFPQSKESLLALTKKGLARPFHEKVFIYNQYATNFSKWLTLKGNETSVSISHIVTNFEFLYEPFYIALDTVPIHDERFTGYGFTRNSQVYEMYVAGYKFYVLSPVFTCHWGLQRKQARPAWREQQNNANRKKFDSFKSEIFARYKNDPHIKVK